MHVIAGLDREEGGPPEACFQLCSELARMGHHVAIYTTDNSRMCVRIAADGAEVRGLEIRRFPVHLNHKYALSIPLLLALRSEVASYDLVHINSLYLFSSTVAAHYCRSYNVPYIVRPHGTLDPYMFRRHRLRKAIYERLIEWRNLEHAAAVHFTSEEERDLVARLGLRIKSVVVPLGVHLPASGSTRPTGQLRRRWPELKGKRLVLYLGRLNFKKGLDLLAGAFGEIAGRRHDLHLVIAGPDNENYSRRVRGWLVQAGVSEKATFTGFLAGEDKRDALAEATVFVLPSYSENFGIAVVEAMAAAVPVVISNKVNIWREVAAAGAGLVTDCDQHTLAEAIRRLVENPEMATRMGQRGRQLVEKQFTWGRMARQMLGVYQNILAGCEPASRSAFLAEPAQGHDTCENSHGATKNKQADSLAGSSFPGNKWGVR